VKNVVVAKTEDGVVAKVEVAKTEDGVVAKTEDGARLLPPLLLQLVVEIPKFARLGKPKATAAKHAPVMLMDKDGVVKQLARLLIHLRVAPLLLIPIRHTQTTAVALLFARFALQGLKPTIAP
jgi:hypothetical protein